jgi:hypothetical protein
LTNGANAALRQRNSSEPVFSSNWRLGAERSLGGSTLARLEAGIDQIRLDLAEIKGKLSNMPTTVTLFGLVITVFAAAFGMSLAVIKLGH